MFKKLLKKKCKEKRIPDKTYRIIKISKDALFEFIYESFIDGQECFLDISDGTSVVHASGIDWDEDSFTFIARNAKDDYDFFEEIDVQKISKAISDTTSTMYAGGRYIDLTQEQINEIQEKY